MGFRCQATGFCRPRGIGRTSQAGALGVLPNGFLKAHPFGTVPAAFSPDGRVGVFESNSIMRLVARLGEARLPLYGTNAFEASRIDSFLDASLGFATESQRYLLSLRDDALMDETYVQAAEAFAGYMAGIDRALSTKGPHIATTGLSIADICFVCELALLSGEWKNLAALERIERRPVFGTEARSSFPYAVAHFERLLNHQAFAPDLASYVEKTGLRTRAD
jgi:glutathione S-transferase